MLQLPLFCKTGAHAPSSTKFPASIRMIFLHTTCAALTDALVKNSGVFMSYKIASSIALILASAPVMAAEKNSEKESANTLTHGMVQMTLHVGQTTQLEVVEAFGAPNITTLDGQGQEVWVYDRQATVSSSGSSGFSIGMLVGVGGGGGAGGGGIGFGSSKSKSTQSQRSMTLVIKFDASKKVSDFKSRSSAF